MLKRPAQRCYLPLMRHKDRGESMDLRAESGEYLLSDTEEKKVTGKANWEELAIKVEKEL